MASIQAQVGPHLQQQLPLVLISIDWLDILEQFLGRLPGQHGLQHEMCQLLRWWKDGDLVTEFGLSFNLAFVSSGLGRVRGRTPPPAPGGSCAPPPPPPGLSGGHTFPLLATAFHPPVLMTVVISSRPENKYWKGLAVLLVYCLYLKFSSLFQGFTLSELSKLSARYDWNRYAKVPFSVLKRRAWMFQWIVIALKVFSNIEFCFIKS